VDCQTGQKLQFKRFRLFFGKCPLSSEVTLHISSTTLRLKPTFLMAIIIQQGATEYSLFKSVNCSTCFGWYFTHRHELITHYLQYLALMRPVLPRDVQPRSRQVAVQVSLMPDTVDTVLWVPDDGRNIARNTLISWHLTFWRWIIFLILAHHVYKMWIIQAPNTLELWNKLHFEEEKTESICHV
jgi:hypothetical protein